jgi:CRP-like cAMP-binding protein
VNQVEGWVSGKLRTQSNQLLAALSAPALRLLRGDLQAVDLAYGQVLYEPRDIIRKVYFPIDCLVSLLTAVDKGRTLEVGMVGSEGMIGMPSAFGIPSSSVRALVQGGGTAICMTAASFRSAVQANTRLQKALFRYSHNLMSQVSQTAACNRFHEVEPRLGRWLLMTADRLQSSEFRLTHEFLSHMLGVRRVGVTQAARSFEHKGLIEYSRGNIKILSRSQLEFAACSCYQVVRDLHLP